VRDRIQRGTHAVVIGCKGFFQRLVFAKELNAELEIGNHAAAGSLAFLLSAVPSLLLSFGITSFILQALPHANRGFQHWTRKLFTLVHLPNSAPQIFGDGLFSLGTAAAVLGMIYSSRVLFRSIRRTFRVIWGTPDTMKTSWLATLGGYALELGALLLFVVILGLSEAGRSMAMSNRRSLDRETFALVVSSVKLIPFAVLWVFFVLTLRFFPSKKPSFLTTALYSLVAVFAYALIVQILGAVINTNQYELLYGIVANLVVVLVKVSALFNLYFMTAVLLWVRQNFHALLFTRYFQNWSKPQLSLPDKWLFKDPTRLRGLYGRSFQATEVLFSQGDPGKTVFFIEEGSVDILVPGSSTKKQETHLSNLGPGQFFGEAAAMFGEPRGATARAKTTLQVLELPASIFRFYLDADRLASTHMIGTLEERLKQANSRTVDHPES